MTCIAAIGIDDEQNIATHLSDSLHPNFAVVATDILFLQSGPQEDSRRVVEAEPSFAQRTLTLRFVPLKEIVWLVYALSVPQSNALEQPPRETAQSLPNARFMGEARWLKRR